MPGKFLPHRDLPLEPHIFCSYAIRPTRHWCHQNNPLYQHPEHSFHLSPVLYLPVFFFPPFFVFVFTSFLWSTFSNSFLNKEYIGSKFSYLFSTIFLLCKQFSKLYLVTLFSAIIFLIYKNSFLFIHSFTNIHCISTTSSCCSWTSRQ